MCEPRWENVLYYRHYTVSKNIERLIDKKENKYVIQNMLKINEYTFFVSFFSHNIKINSSEKKCVKPGVKKEYMYTFITH